MARYTVRRGDTWFTIAQKYNTNAADLLRRNTDVDRLQAGQVIDLPGAGAPRIQNYNDWPSESRFVPKQPQPPAQVLSPPRTRWARQEQEEPRYTPPQVSPAPYTSPGARRRVEELPPDPVRRPRFDTEMVTPPEAAQPQTQFGALPPSLIYTGLYKLLKYLSPQMQIALPQPQPVAVGRRPPTAPVPRPQPSREERLRGTPFEGVSAEGTPAPSYPLPPGMSQVRANVPRKALGTPHTLPTFTQPVGPAAQAIARAADLRPVGNLRRALAREAREGFLSGNPPIKIFASIAPLLGLDAGTLEEMGYFWDERTGAWIRGDPRLAPPTYGGGGGGTAKFKKLGRGGGGGGTQFLPWGGFGGGGGQRPIVNINFPEGRPSRQIGSFGLVTWRI